MNLADAFKKLEGMHASGELTEGELAAAKEAIGANGEADLEAQIEALKQQRAEIEQLDRDWQREREEFVVVEKFGYRSIPTRWGTIVNAIAIVIFGIVWVAVSLGRTPFFFPMVGVLVSVVGVIVCVPRYNKASAHDAAYERYQRRRAALLAEHERDRQ
jgi:hypothetical protein